VLLVFGAPCQLRLLAGQEHGRTIPLTDIRPGDPQMSCPELVLSDTAQTPPSFLMYF
jgi:hypothetical protein